MKRTITTLAFGLLSLAASAQATESILFSEDFSTEINSALTTTTSAFQHNANLGVGQLQLDPLSQNYELSWTSSEELSSGIDSIEAEVSIAIEPGYISVNNNLVTIQGGQNYPVIFEEQSFNIIIQQEIIGNFTKATSGEYITAKNTYKGENISETLNIITLNKLPAFYEITGNQNSYFGHDPLTVASSFCVGEFPQSQTCLQEIQQQLINQQGGILQNLLVDDIKITAYSTVTGIEDKVFYNNKEVKSVYNTAGQASSFDAVNEVIIIKYTDGSTERVFNIR